MENDETDDADDASGFLQAAYALDANNQHREAADFSIDKLDDLLNEQEFSKCNRILRTASPKEMSDLLIVTFLGITLGAKDTLTSRPAFYARALIVVSERRGEDGADKLLAKYR